MYTTNVLTQGEIRTWKNENRNQRWDERTAQNGRRLQFKEINWRPKWQNEAKNSKNIELTNMLEIWRNKTGRASSWISGGDWDEHKEVKTERKIKVLRGRVMDLQWRHWWEIYRLWWPWSSEKTKGTKNTFKDIREEKISSTERKAELADWKSTPRKIYI